MKTTWKKTATKSSGRRRTPQDDYCRRGVADDDVKNDVEYPQPKEQLPSETIDISSYSDTEGEEHEDVRGIGLFEKEEEKWEAVMPSIPIVEDIPYLPNSAPRRTLSHPTQQFRKYTACKRIEGGILYHDL
ncbi:hypothetical protein PIB30_045479 [Stylosanthes scabra]|uniref:Uncharacterized protein n=1 Tax=Stylosanthes scabra TaxID=79078 RepID=A0ABU6WEJ4_9FABA|nr:hypothetical protein [Stylosanthes scabra]